MNIRTLPLLLVFIFLNTIEICAQTQTRVGFLPSINYNHKINKVWEANVKLESRHFVFDNNSTQNGRFNYSYSLSDISALAGRKVGLNSKIVVGFLTRLEPNAIAYRTIQQFIFQTKLENLRVVHRITTDQTFSASELPEFRLRYRLNAEIPLSGIKVDVKEFYFKLNTELLNSIQNSVFDMEVRLVPNIGYVINERNKVEIGFDNRLASFIESPSRFTSWITLNWFF